MNDVTQTEDTSEDFDELTVLKHRADMLGIKYHPSTGLDKLKAKINNTLGTAENTSSSAEVPKDFKILTHKEFKQERKARAKKLANALVRVRVTCMNPAKKEWEGEIFSVGSAKLGTFKKYIPYNVEWHIPHIMYESLKERKCAVFHTVKDHLGQKIRKSKLVPEFSIEVLPPLTKKELEDLVRKQAMSGSMTDG